MFQFRRLVVLRAARVVKSRHRDRRRHRDALAARGMQEDNRSLPTIIKPEETRMQSQAQIDEVLRKTSDAKEIPGVVAIAASGNDVLYQGAFGKRDLSKPDAMTADSVFWIASMTKAVTTAGAMQLVEQGKLSLDAPIGEVLPDLAKPQVLEGFDAKGEPKLRPAKGPITLRQLMTHTAGFCYDMWNGNMGIYLEKTGTPGIITCQNAALKTPIASDPGTRWEYGTNIDFVGKAVEAVSGKRLDAYLRDSLFTPLGMSDTGFKITDDMRKRLVGMHARGEDGQLGAIPFELEQAPEFCMGGGGLYSTAADYIRFTQMILNKGRGNGNQVLKAETVATMGQNHIGDLNVTKMTSVAPMYTNDVDLYPDQVKKWGLSFLINTAKTPEGRSPNSLAWAGLANTYYWIDPARDVTGVILMQVLPFADGKCLEAFAGFERGVYAGLDAGSGQKAA
ncbi:bll0805 [Bradyrhizobium diazoefficiens USDA 110]|uniref:Bll0805 protein n=2 Tax=Bradyrhizobium diazoefficiens TaxID=1355477 RepID=Q89W88_BRADU|nr:1,4-butanediol diacrylate esterase [Bradyrhizobium diazoefficiens]QBP19753.1 class A beta-lactamase-related serine hydrolase [Bradyrhizobium diazoefficiens]BAC46070.1 bll0805 [Bradyrhizobium diazoefficiens USDA 110]